MLGLLPNHTRQLRRFIAGLTLLFLVASISHMGWSNVLEVYNLAALRLSAWRNYETTLHTAGTGLDPIPFTVTGAIDLLKAANVKNYRVSPGISADGFLYQRISEIAWPRALDPTAPFVLRKQEEESACSPLSMTAGVALDRCD